MSIIRKTFKIDGVLTNMTSVKLSDETGAFGVKRNDTDAVVVADDTALNNIGPGRYNYEFTDPADDLIYTVALEVVYGGETYHIEETLDGPAAAAGVITKSDIIKEVLKKLGGFGLKVSNIDGELLEILQEIAKRGNFLEAHTTFDTEDGTAAYTEPTRLKYIEEVYITDGDRLTLGSYAEYRREVSGYAEAAVPTGGPGKYCRHKGEIYVYGEVPGAVYEINVDYYKYHAASIATIEYADELKGAIVAGVMYKLWAGQMAQNEHAQTEGEKYLALFARELGLDIKTLPQKPVIIKPYKDYL